MGQSIFSNVVVAAISRVFVVLLGLLATALMVRLVSVESFGAYSLLLTIGTFVQLFADFGLYLTASRELGAAHGKSTEVMRYIVSFRMLLLGILFIMGLIALALVPATKNLLFLFFVIAIGLIAQSVSQLMMGVFQAYGDVWKASVGDILGRAVQLGMLWYLFVYGSNSPLMGIAFAFTIGLCVACLIHVILVPQRKTLFPKISLSAWRYLVHSSWPIGLMLILNVIYFRADILILSFFRSGEEVGWYALAYKIIENGLFFPAMVGGLLLPHITSAVTAKDNARAGEIVSQGLTLSLYIAIIVVAALLTFPTSIISLIAGPAFYPSSALLQVLSLALAIMFMGNIFGFALIALAKQRTLALLYGCLVVFNIALNVLAIPYYGAIAAAWVTVATEAVAMVAAGYIVHKAFRYRFSFQSLALAIGAAAVGLYVAAILPPIVHIVVRLIVAVVLYALACYAMGLFHKKALSILMTARAV